MGFPIPVDLQFGAENFSGGNFVVVAGKKDVLAQESVVRKIASFLQAQNAVISKAAADAVKEPLFQTVLGSISPGDNGDTASWYLTSVPAGDAEKPKPFRFLIAALPSTYSRHNAPSRADALAELIKKSIPGSGNGLVVLVVDKPENAFASTSAVARVLPLYSKKTSSETPESRTVVVDVIFASDESAKLDLPRTIAAANGIRNAARMVDAPTSEMFTDDVVNEAKAIAEKHGASITVIRGKELDEKGFGGLWGVGKAATHPPALVVLSHTPAGASKTIAWVGKGIVYDTGGLSIKTPTTAMAGMKRDLGGTAAVLFAFDAALSAGFSQNLHALLCLAENSVGPDSTRPDDILYMYSGKTVEVNNTDAEGRLVLADGIAYAVKHLQPDVLVDVATLTGAQGIATGKKHAAVVSNDEELEAAAVAAGKSSGDLVWPLPYAPEFFRAEFVSAVADMKNTSKDRFNGGSSAAAQFIADHLGSYQGKWLHVDMAYPVFNGERATGYGVALLLDLFQKS